MRERERERATRRCAALLLLAMISNIIRGKHQSLNQSDEQSVRPLDRRMSTSTVGRSVGLYDSPTEDDNSNGKTNLLNDDSNLGVTRFPILFLSLLLSSSSPSVSPSVSITVSNLRTTSTRNEVTLSELRSTGAKKDTEES